MIDCPQCAILLEEILHLRSELGRRDTVLTPPPHDTLPSPSEWLRQCELLGLDAPAELSVIEGP